MDECQSSQIHNLMTRLKIINGDEKLALTLVTAVAITAPDFTLLQGDLIIPLY